MIFPARGRRGSEIDVEVESGVVMFAYLFWERSDGQFFPI